MAVMRLLGTALVWSLTFSTVCSLRIAWLAPGPQSTNRITSDTSVAALKLALRSVAKTAKGSGKNVGIKFFDTDCTAQSAMTAMFAQRDYNPDVIIGPPCKDAMRSVAEMAGVLNAPLFGWYNPDSEFDDVKKYPTLIRMSPSVTLMAQSLIRLMHQNGWRRFVLLHDVDDLGMKVMQGVVNEASNTADVNLFSIKRLKPGLSNAQLVMIFNTIKKHSTIIALACAGNTVRRYMLAAQKVGMTNGQFVFIQLDYKIYTDSELQRTILSDGGWRRGDMDDADARQAYEALIHIVLDPMSDDGKMARNLPRSRFEEFAKLALAGADIKRPEWELPVVSSNIDSLFPTSSAVYPDVYSLFLYDSVVVWSVLVDVMNRSGIDHKNGQLVAHMAKNFFADGATGYISVDDHLDRVGKVFIMDMAFNGNFKPVQVLRFNRTRGFDVKNLAPIRRMFRWSSQRSGIQQTPSDIPPATTTTTTTTTTTRRPTTTTTTTTRRPTTTTTTTKRPTTTTTTTTPKPTTTTRATTTTTTKPTTTTSTTAAPDPMNIIMERLAKLEAFLKKKADTPKQTTTGSGPGIQKTIPNKVSGSNSRIGKGLHTLKQNFAESAKGKKVARGRNIGTLAKNGARQTGRKRVLSREQEELPVQRGRKPKRKQKPKAPEPEPVVYPTDSSIVFDMYETTTADSLVVGASNFGAAVDQLFATGVGMSQERTRNSGPSGSGRRRGGARNQQKQRKRPLLSRQRNALKTNSQLATADILAAGIGSNQKLTDPLIDQISAKVAARLSNSISQKLQKAKEKIKKKDQNYAVHIIGDWIPPTSEDSPPQMNMTVQVNRTNNKDLKVTAQGMTVEENTISKKTIDTAKGKTSSVTIEPPKKKDEKKAAMTEAPKPSKDILTVTVAPHPMAHYPWPYMYPTTMPAWMQNQENEQHQQQQQQYDPQQHMYPQQPYPYPHPYPPAAPSSGEGHNATVHYPPPPYGAHFPPPHYPMYPHYPHWGGGRQSRVVDAR